MEYTTQHHQIGLTLLSGVGSKRARLILAHFADLEEFYREKRLNISSLPRVDKNYASFQKRQEVLQKADEILQELEKKKAQILFFTDKKYPNRLKQCADAPLLLYTKGSFDWEKQKIVSIVGTRNASAYGKKLTEDLVAELAAHEVTIVSGMAYGIDILAHQLAVKHKLETWGVLGHGIGSLYPSEHKNTAIKMFEDGGLISEFFPSQKAEPHHFPMRNRIVAGLSDCTIVVESGEKGGSLITAKLAFDYNREVFAFPGDVGRPYSKGCLNLIKHNQAQLITSAEDIIKQMSWNDEKKKQSAIQTKIFYEATDLEQQIIDKLKESEFKSLDNLSYSIDSPIGKIAASLSQLELNGIVQCLPGRRYKLN